MTTPRHHLAIGQRSPTARRQATEAERWIAAIREAQATRADLAVSVAIDGIALVDSRTVQDSAHEVRVVDVLHAACCAEVEADGYCPTHNPLGGSYGQVRTELAVEPVAHQTTAREARWGTRQGAAGYSRQRRG